MAAIGVAAGLVGAFLASSLLQRLLYGTSPTDPATFAGVAVLLLSVAFLASYLPARRAARLDPVVALRPE